MSVSKISQSTVVTIHMTDTLANCDRERERVNIQVNLVSTHPWKIRKASSSQSQPSMIKYLTLRPRLGMIENHILELWQSNCWSNTEYDALISAKDEEIKES